MYACGLRIGEAATLEIASIDSDSLLLRIIGKGNKDADANNVIESRNIAADQVDVNDAA
jgi:site-specific recombinase XerD